MNKHPTVQGKQLSLSINLKVDCPSALGFQQSYELVNEVMLQAAK